MFVWNISDFYDTLLFIFQLRRVHCSDKGDFQSKMVCFEYDLKLEKDKNRRLDEENQAYKARYVARVD